MRPPIKHITAFDKKGEFHPVGVYHQARQQNEMHAEQWLLTVEQDINMNNLKKIIINYFQQWNATHDNIFAKSHK